MTLVTRDPATGLRHNPPRWPHGTVPAPSGCRWCGVEEHRHRCTWLPWGGKHGHFHGWERPTDAQILARMLARRRLAGRPIPVRSPVPCDEMTHDSVGNEVFCRLELGHEEDHDGGRVTWPRED